MKKYGMGGTSRTHGRYEKCIQYLSEGPKGRDHLQNLGISGRIILKCVLMK
jgi:hypothetical protein